MSPAFSVMSQTLQSIMTTKMREQNKRRKLFENHKSQIIQDTDKTDDLVERLKTLLRGIKQDLSINTGVGYFDNDLNSLIENINRHVEQAEYDPSVSPTILQNFEASLRNKLDQESRRLEFAGLYYRLLVEWADPSHEPIADPEQISLDGLFDHVNRDHLKQLKDKFARVAFTPRETEIMEIRDYLDSLFDSDQASCEALRKLRDAMRTFGQTFIRRKDPFNNSVLKTCIRGLLRNRIMNEGQRVTMKDLLGNDNLLDEIASVLNPRFADLRGWSWEADDGIYYEPRRQSNGKWRIVMDQEVLQAIFLHYIAVSWSAEFKTQFREIAANREFWKGPTTMSPEEEARFYYFNGYQPEAKGIESVKRTDNIETFFCESLPDKLSNGGKPYDTDSGQVDEDKTVIGMRQTLLRQIAVDVIVRRSLYGNVAVIQSDLQWYASGIPHSTLFAVLRFWGVPEEWMTFFKKFVEAPLRADKIPGKNVRIRKRGIPITDAFETLFGESLLFAMDVAVNQQSGMTLYRFHDDLWLCGEPRQCATAWEAIKGFVSVLGLEINTTKTGSIYLSDKPKDPNLENKFPDGDVCVEMLKLTNSGEWVIDRAQVDAHVRQLQKQLGACTSIISWVQTWNACMGRFFKHAFGPPANCFGQAHVTQILETYKRMQKELFGGVSGGSVTEYLRNVISHRHGVSDTPDSFLYLPEELGGLGLQNPFITFFAVKQQLYKNPEDRIRELKKKEAGAYKVEKETYDALTKEDRKYRLKLAFEPDEQNVFSLTSSLSPTSPYMSFEEYTQYREVYSPQLKAAYGDLMQRPTIKDVELTHDNRDLFTGLKHSHSISWSDLTFEKKWVMNLYAQDLTKQFGALSVVDKSALPKGVIDMQKKQKKVIWPFHLSHLEYQIGYNTRMT